ncbi:MAG: PAS domain S-box protein [Anaeromyxobacteraceae bacterium]
MRSIVEAIPHMVWIAGPDGANLYNSPSLLAYTGLTDADVARDGWTRTIHPDDLTGAVAFWQERVGTGGPGTRVHRIRRQDGAFRWCQVAAAPLRGPDGAVLRWIGTWTDVHDAKLAEEALRASEAKLRLAKDAAHMGAWEWDLATGARTFSGRCRALFALPAGGEVDEAELLPAVHPDDRVRYADALARAVREHAPVLIEVRVPGAGAEPRVVELRGQAFFRPDGTAERVAGMALDVTERRRIEDALRASERDARRRSAELEAVLDAVPAAVFITRDPAARFIEANAAGRELIAIPPGANASLGAPAEERPAFVALKDGVPLTLDQMPMQAAARFGVSVSGFEYDVLRPDGTVRHVIANARPIVDSAGERQGAVGAIVDVTEQKQATEALRRSDQRKSDFLAVLSHELRNPLAPIRNAVYLLERAEPGSPQAVRAKDVIRRQSDHLAKLVDDLLDLSRVDHGKIRLDRKPIDGAEVIRRAAEDARPGFDARGVALRVSAPEGPAILIADPVRLAQIAGNLLGNALKFTPPGGAVDVEVRTGRGNLELVVRDTGVGIEPDLLERVFEPFAQAERARSTGHGGLGIGLALVRSLAVLHGGMAVARAPASGRGAELVVTLPLGAGNPAEAAAPSPAPGQGLSILIVEDNADAGETLADLLRLQGHRTRLAADGGSALVEFGASRPDVLISDVGLPDMDGYEVIRRVRALEGGRATYAVALTGFAQPEDVRRAREAGFDAHLAKPPPLDDLERLLADAARAR